MSFQNLFKALGESECVSSWNYFWNWNKQTNKQKKTLNLSFHPRGPRAKVNLCRPPRQVVPPRAPHDPVCLSVGWALQCPHRQSQLEKWDYCEDNFRSECRPNPKTGSARNGLAVPISSLGSVGRDTTPGLTKWQTTLTFSTKSNAKWRLSLSIFAKPCTPGYACANECVRLAQREIKASYSSSSWPKLEDLWNSCLHYIQSSYNCIRIFAWKKDFCPGKELLGGIWDQSICKIVFQILKACCYQTPKPINLGGNWLIEYQPSHASSHDSAARWEIAGDSAASL